MKKTFLFVVLAIMALTTNAQSHYWVMLTDKAGTTFDPYSYFDSKAIERYKLNNADLYDISNYPLNDSYVQQIDAVVTDLQSGTEVFGQSRWLNAVAVTATPDQIAKIKQLPFVKEVVMLTGNMQLTQQENVDWAKWLDESTESTVENPSAQIVRMGYRYFRDKGINGKGVRIAVFDGGFPQVNTHKVFQHLRDNGQIIKTWNFPNKKENVYGWNSHGLMTLSCIAGINQYQGSESVINMDLGLATGAEFLLARTEVNSEPFKEEVWWQMAVEWADQNGAKIISSSLGYGKDRYYTKDMDGQSYVAKAGNMAARKGILVCNSAGNEGSDRTWRTIITPSDADSVLCVGGITNSLDEYEHISFSSYGPSADGRQKPNVVAFGHANTANTGNSNDKTHYVDGTSFSCPLVAGFAACALQAHPELTAMQLFHEIEKSSDLYPYCDYTFGYGVPQADYFTGDRKTVKPTFKFVYEDSTLRLVPLKDYNKCRIFIKSSSPDGTIHSYKKIELDTFTTDMYLEITSGDIITAQLDGYAQSYELKNGTYMSIYGIGFPSLNYDETDNVHFQYSLNEKKSLGEWYAMLGLPINIQDDELDHSFWSPAKRIGFRKTHYFAKAYGWGFAFEYGHTSFHLGNEATRLDSLAAMDDDIRWLDKNVSKHQLNVGELGIEIYQRVRLLPAGLMHKGLHWDLGVYGNYAFNAYKLKGQHQGDIASSRKQVVRNLDLLDNYHWNWGVTTRLTYDIVGIYARFRLNDIGKDVPAGSFILPQLEAGIQLAF